MGVFLQYALFPGCGEAAARMAVDAPAKNPAFEIRPERCRFADTGKGTQVFLDGDLEFAPLARVLSQAIASPVMLLYLYDGDCWGYDFCSGEEEDHFSTQPDYFGYIEEEERRYLAGRPEMLRKWFGNQEMDAVLRYLVHWTVLGDSELATARFACPSDRYPYGDGWQVTDFAARLGFPWPFGEVEEVIPAEPAQPVLREILERELPPPKNENMQSLLGGSLGQILDQQRHELYSSLPSCCNSFFQDGGRNIMAPYAGNAENREAGYQYGKCSGR